MSVPRIRVEVDQDSIRRTRGGPPLLRVVGSNVRQGDSAVRRHTEGRKTEDCGRPVLKLVKPGVDSQPYPVVPGRSPATFGAGAGMSGLRALRGAAIALACVAMVVLGLVVGTLLLPAGHQTVVVQSGDTLWTIASRVDDAPSTAKAVADIAQLNSLGSWKVQSGQKLVLPRY